MHGSRPMGRKPPPYGQSCSAIESFLSAAVRSRACGPAFLTRAVQPSSLVRSYPPHSCGPALLTPPLTAPVRSALPSSLSRDDTPSYRMTDLLSSLGPLTCWVKGPALITRVSL